MANSLSITQSVKLNNFLHRIDCKAILLKLASDHTCALKRSRRSRNWILTGNNQQLTQMSEKLRMNKKTLWIARAINDALPKPSFDLAFIIKTNPNITVNQLISVTGCTTAEARTAIDNAEGLVD